MDVINRIVLILITLTLHSWLAVDGARHPRKYNFSGREPTKSKNFSEIMKHDIESAIRTAEDQIEKLATFELNIQASGVKTDKLSPFYGQMADFLPSREAVNSTKSAFIAIKAAQHLASKFCLRDPKIDNCINQISTLKLTETSLGNVCDDIYKLINCDGDVKFRSIEGSCNNLKMPAWGKSNTAYRRIVKPDYDDGLNSLRSSAVGDKQLPSPRLVSTMLAESKRVPDPSKTQAMAVWGLFIGYDMAYTPASNMVNIENAITCCTSDGRPLPPRHNHISCAPISIPRTDLFYQKFFQTCMNYVRSLPAMRSDCTFGPTEQMNQASHFIDGSVIYGSTKNKMNSLRTKWGGRLITSLRKNGDEYPPFINDSETPCHLNSSKCYVTGDARVNSHPQLRVLHTLFVREHNRIADQLATLNEHWDDDRLYEESRKIVIAEIQHITYAHWLPRLLGKKYTKRNGLELSQHSFGYSYDENVEPSISNSFATAALPLVNSMIDENIGLYLENRNIADVHKLKEHFHQRSLANQSAYFDSVVRGLATQNSEKIDLTFPDALTRYWYTPSGDFGMDLFSLDIQRGRDHGIPPYVEFRKACNLSLISSFKDLRGIMAQNTINRLEVVYKKIENIDLVVGIASELPLKDVMVGPTLQCILGEQFLRSKLGDRFFYDNGDQPGSFTKAQLEQVKRSNLARIFCDNGNNVVRMQSDVFTVPNIKHKNELLFCQETTLPFLDLTAWKEKEDEYS